MESCACASLERKLLQGWLQIMLTLGLATPRVVAFVVSTLIMHVHTHRYLYLPLHTGSQGHLSLCSVAGHTLRTNYWPVRTWVLSVALTVPASCALQDSAAASAPIPSVPDTAGWQALNSSGFSHDLMEKHPSTPCAKKHIAQFCPLSETPFINWRNQMWELAGSLP